jgi:hypothetical protein
MKPNIEKAKAIILYLIRCCQEHKSGISPTKLNKLMYFIDFGAFALHGYSITGVPYLKLEFGPVNTFANDLVTVLQYEKKIQAVEIPVKGKISKQFQLIDDPGSEIRELFSDEEWAIIDKTIKARGWNYAVVASTESHFHPSWVVTPVGEVIDYDTAKDCVFEWLNYFGEGRSREDYEETMAIRDSLRQNKQLSERIRNLKKRKE